MNKTVSINLMGVVFNIEEDAYESLKKYIELLSQHFSGKEGQEEIISDIEARFAELFQERLANEEVQILNVEHVQACINKMGLPEDFDTETYDFENETITHEKPKKRLYRNADDNILGGVCAGITNYFGFNDPVWLRIAFVLLVIFSGGTIVLLYLFLWLIVPEARLPYEKLAMKGEPVNVSNIERVVQTELDNLKSNLEPGAKQASSSLGGFVGTLWNGFLEILKLFFKFILKVGKWFVVFVAGIIILALSISLLVATFSIIKTLPTMSTYIFNSAFSAIGWSLSFLTTFSIIMFSLIYFLWRLAKGGTSRFKFGDKSKIIAGVGFLAAIICGIFTMQLSNNFTEREFAEKSLQIAQPISDTLHIDIDTREYERYRYKRNNSFGFSLGPIVNSGNVRQLDGNLVDQVYLDIEASESGVFELIQTSSAKGKSTDEALSRANNVNVSYTQTNDKIKFQPYYKWAKNDKYRDQEADLILKVPTGKYVYIGKNTRPLLARISNVNKLQRKEMQEHLFVMGKQGLVCVDCENIKRKQKGKSALSNSVDWDFENFNEVEVSGAFEVEITKAEDYSVEVFADDDDDLDKVKISQSGDKLKVTIEKKGWSMGWNSGSAKVVLSCPSLVAVDFAGATSGTIKGFAEDGMEITLAGAANCKAEVSAEMMEVDIVGASGLELIGECTHLEADVVGASSLEAFNFRVVVAEVSTSGASSAEVFVMDELDADASGASSIEYKGAPESVNADASGASSIDED